MAKRKVSRTRKPANRRSVLRNTDSLIAEAVQASQSGYSKQAAQICKSLISAGTQNPIPFHLLGVIMHQAGRLDTAVKLLFQAIEIAPGYNEADGDLGAILFELERYEEAVIFYTKKLTDSPADIPAWMNLGNTNRSLGRPDEAIRCYKEALRLDPRLAGAYVNIGVINREQGDPERALEYQRCALSINPNLAQAHSNIGKAFMDTNHVQNAHDAFQQASKLEPTEINHLISLSNCCLRMGYFTDAITAINKATDLQPENPTLWFQLGVAHQAAGQTETAINFLEQASVLNPSCADTLSNLGYCYFKMDRLEDSQEACLQAISYNAECADAYINLGNVQRELGRLEEAISSYEKALVIQPSCVSAYSNILLTLHALPSSTPSGILAAHIKWDKVHGLPVDSIVKVHANLKDPKKRLKLGFVSADLGYHPVGYFTIGFFENYDRKKFNITVYSGRLPDAMTERFKTNASHWVDIGGMNDTALSAKIVDDEIDILFDLSGHTTNNRLATFARKPAPIQISWSGYPGTTGLSAMDFLVSDPRHTPSEDHSYYREKMITLPDSFICYSPPEHAPDVSPPPSEANGFFTFGCFSNPSKINTELLLIWAQLMKVIPKSRLLMIYKNLNAPENHARISSVLSAAGIEPSRILIEGRQEPIEFMKNYGRVDVAFDSFPYSGGVTTCEALWMGVPVISYPGDTFASRHAFSLLTAAGLDNFIIENKLHFIDKVRTLTDGSNRLSSIRSSLRAKIASSALCDPQKYTRNLERALIKAWRDWCLY